MNETVIIIILVLNTAWLIFLGVLSFRWAGKLDRWEKWLDDRNSFLWALQILNYDGQYQGHYANNEDFEDCLWHDTLVKRSDLPKEKDMLSVS
jgi:hypothetical protein